MITGASWQKPTDRLFFPKKSFGENPLNWHCKSGIMLNQNKSELLAYLFGAT